MYFDVEGGGKRTPYFAPFFSPKTSTKVFLPTTELGLQVFFL